MQRATKKILKDIHRIEADSMSSDKTKLLAYVLSILAERNLNE